MKFLIDAQLPLRLSNLLAEADHDSIHTSDLPDGNRTSDHQLADIADSENRVVVTKDRDFRDSHLLQKAHQGRAIKLLIANQDIRVIDQQTGQLLRQHTLDPTHDYQPLKQPRTVYDDPRHQPPMSRHITKVETAGSEPAQGSRREGD